jgi:hypothetical protein
VHVLLAWDADDDVLTITEVAGGSTPELSTRNVSMGLWKAGNLLVQKAAVLADTAGSFNESLGGNARAFINNSDLQWIIRNVPQVCGSTQVFTVHVSCALLLCETLRMAHHARAHARVMMRWFGLTPAKCLGTN